MILDFLHYSLPVGMNYRQSEQRNREGRDGKTVLSSKEKCRPDIPVLAELIAKRLLEEEFTGRSRKPLLKLLKSLLKSR